MKLYLIHCGFYDPIAGDGIYELHTNLFTVGESIEQARANVKSFPEYRQKKMHIDGIQEIVRVDGYDIDFKAKKLPSLGDTVVHSTRSSFARISKKPV